MADGGVSWVAYVVSQEIQQASRSGVRFFFVAFVLSASQASKLLYAQVECLPLLRDPWLNSCPRLFRDGHNSCSVWVRQDGSFACDSLGEGPSVGLPQAPTRPSRASLLVATNVDLQPTGPFLASRWLVRYLGCMESAADGFNQTHRIEREPLVSMPCQRTKNAGLRALRARPDIIPRTSGAQRLSVPTTVPRYICPRVLA